jgi:hypothetical protein
VYWFSFGCDVLFACLGIGAAWFGEEAGARNVQLWEWRVFKSAECELLAASNDIYLIVNMVADFNCALKFACIFESNSKWLEFRSRIARKVYKGLP